MSVINFETIEKVSDCFHFKCRPGNYFLPSNKELKGFSLMK